MVLYSGFVNERDFMNIDHETNKRRAERLRKACNGNIDPKAVAESILDNEDKHSPEAFWIAGNYQMALAYIGLLEVHIELLEAAARGRGE